jgi:hypothetical protein
VPRASAAWEALGDGASPLINTLVTSRTQIRAARSTRWELFRKS